MPCERRAAWDARSSTPTSASCAARRFPDRRWPGRPWTRARLARSWCYWTNPEATAETIRDGWLRTGDLATVDEEGFITLTGRERDMFISGGENVYPAQVEATYEAHPDIAEIAVVGVPDPRWGEAGRAYVVLREGAPFDSEALRLWGRERLARFKIPEQFVVQDALPRTVTGKVQKFALER